MRILRMVVQTCSDEDDATGSMDGSTDLQRLG